MIRTKTDLDKNNSDQTGINLTDSNENDWNQTDSNHTNTNKTDSDEKLILTKLIYTIYALAKISLNSKHSISVKSVQI